MNMSNRRASVLPNFLIIGAEKSATTWLYARLKEHPEVFLPDTKEAHFFNRYTSNLEVRNAFERQGLDWYKRLFRGHTGETAVGEATPLYLCDPDAPVRIRETLPDVRLVCSLRHPVDRAYSHYWMARRKGHTNRSFEEVVARREPRFIQRGLYGQQLARYYDLFPRRQMRVLIQETLLADPRSNLKALCRFLKVDPRYYDEADGLTEQENSAAMPRSRFVHRWTGRLARTMRYTKGLDTVLDFIKATGLAGRLKSLNRAKKSYPALRPELRRELAAFYADDIDRLEGLLGRRIAAWR